MRRQIRPPKTVLTLDRIAIKRNGVHHRYMPEWLLGRQR
jgi:hypothetical protein